MRERFHAALQNPVRDIRTTTFVQFDAIRSDNGRGQLLYVPPPKFNLRRNRPVPSFTDIREIKGIPTSEEPIVYPREHRGSCPRDEQKEEEGRREWTHK